MSKMEENNKTFEQQPETEPEEYGGIMDISNGTQVAIATGFIGLPAFEAALQLLHFGGPVGLAAGALLAGGAALAGKTIIDRQTANGSLPKLPRMQQLRNANWGALLSSTSGEVEQPQPEQRSTSSYTFPVLADEATARLGEDVETRQRFDIPIDYVLGKGVILAGTQGAGKSNTLARIAEQVGKSQMPQIIFDMKREYSSLLDVVPNGIVAGHAGASHELPSRFYELTEQNAAQFARDVMEQGYQAVVDIPSYLTQEDGWNTCAHIITAVLNGLMQWSIAQPAHDRLPCLLSFDEAHIWFPERFEMKSLFDQATLAKLNQAAFSIVNMGRSYGYTLLFATQRIANIAKWTIANSQIKVVMRHTLDIDIKRCREEVGSEIAEQHDIKSLADGYGIVVGLTREPVLVHFDTRASRHDSHTPKIDRVKHFRHVRSTTRPEPLSVHRNRFSGIVPVTPEIVVASTVRTTEPTLPVVPVTPAKSPVEDELERALAAWNEGHTSVEKLQRALQVKHNKAWNLYKQLKEKRLIAV